MNGRVRHGISWLAPMCAASHPGILTSLMVLDGPWGQRVRGELHMQDLTHLSDAKNAPHIAMLADDELAARRVEGVLAGEGLRVSARRRGTDDAASAGGAAPDVLVVVVGRGITERDHQMRRMRRGLPHTAIVAVMPEDSRRG